MLKINGTPKGPYAESAVNKMDKQRREYKYGAQQNKK